MTGRAAAVTATALAVAAAALSAGCSATVAGEARPSSELKAAALEDVAPVADQRVWVDVTGHGVPMPRDSYGAQFSLTEVPVPGVTITYAAFDGGTGGCTLGPAITAAGRSGFLTAGHCALDAAGPQRLTGADGSPVRGLGSADEAVDTDGVPDDSGYAYDSAVVWTPAGTRAGVIAGTWPIAGTLSVDEVRALPSRTPICFAGAMSGVACGPLLSAHDPGGIHFGRTAQTGDSGAAAFVVDDGGSAWLVGVMASTDDYRLASTATLLAPTLDRLGAEAITAR